MLCLIPWSRLASPPKAITVAEEPKSINQIISNQMSNLPQTQRMERDIENFLTKWDIKGASLAIAKDGKLVYSKGFGYADKELGLEMDVDNIMRTASVSKLFTAVAVMKLVDDGKLKLSDKVFGSDGIISAPYFNEFNDKRMADVTVEHLLRHQAGFSSRAGDPMFSPHIVASRLDKSLPLTMDDMVKYASVSRLVFAPGKGTRYSNLGYLLLTKIIEERSGIKYIDYLRKEILEPIGCYDIHIAGNTPSQKLPREVKYYEAKDEEWIASYNDPSTLKPKCYGGNNITGLYGAGAIVASPVEILKFVAAIDGDNSKEDILSKKSVNIMTRYHKKNLPIGWMHTNEKGDWWRTGTLSGTSAMLRKQSDGYSWVFITNSSSWRGARFTGTINAMVRRALSTVDSWPERDMFEFDDELIDSLYNDELVVTEELE